MGKAEAPGSRTKVGIKAAEEKGKTQRKMTII